MAFAPACGGDGDSAGKVIESPNLGETGSVKATAAAGGELSLPESGVTLSIPAGALAEDTEISAEIISKKSLPEATKLAGNVVEFGPDGLNFLTPVSLVIDLVGAKIPDGADVSIAWLDEAKNEWVDLSGSKMENGKVSAKTTHFTKFVVRFVVNDDGDVVQAGGECNTDGFKACGGDIEGTWDFTVGCVTVGGAIGSTDQNPAAKCISADIGVDFSGHVTFSKGTVKGESTVAIDATSKIDKMCLADAFSGMGGQSVKASDIDCSEFAGDPDPGEEAPTIVDSGDMCEITQATQAPQTDTIDGTYAVDGNTLTITDGDSAPEPQEYCIKGNTLTLVNRNDDGSVFMITATRK